MTDKTSGLHYVRVLSLEQTFEILREVTASSEAHLLGEVQHEPGLITASLDATTLKHVGLHIDNWDKLPYEDRHLSSIRFAVNNGPGLRGLWVGNHISHWGWRPDEIPETSKLNDNLLHVTYKEAALIPLPPYHGYIAKTEEFLHDGTTLLASQESTVTTWLIHNGGSLFDRLGGFLGI